MKLPDIFAGLGTSTIETLAEAAPGATARSLPRYGYIQSPVKFACPGSPERFPRATSSTN